VVTGTNSTLRPGSLSCWAMSLATASQSWTMKPAGWPFGPLVGEGMGVLAEAAAEDAVLGDIVQGPGPGVAGGQEAQGHGARPLRNRFISSLFE